MSLVRHKTARLSVCACGFPILHDSIPLGTEYLVDPDRRMMAQLTCGGCRQELQVETVWVKNRSDNLGGYIPAAVFGL